MRFTVDDPVGLASAVAVLIVLLVVGLVRRRPIIGLALGVGAGQVTSQSLPVGLLITAGACIAVWSDAPWRRRPPAAGPAPLEPAARVAIGTQITSSPIVLAAFVAGVLANVGGLLLGLYPPVPRPIRINSWVAGWPWIGGSFLIGIIGGARLTDSHSVAARAVTAFALGWGLGNIGTALVWFVGSLVLLCDAGTDCF